MPSARLSQPPPPALAPCARAKQHLRDTLAAGQYPPSERMPSEAKLLAQFGVSRTTMNRALRELQADYPIEAARATAQKAQLMGIPPQDPCIAVVRRTVTSQHAITLARLVHPGPRYRLNGAFSP